MASRSQPLTALTRRATIILLEFGAEKDEASRVHTIVWRSSECARWVAWDWLRQRKGANAELHDELSGKGIASEADAEKFVQELNDFFENPKQSFPQVVGRLRDGAGEFVDRLGGFLRDPQAHQSTRTKFLATCSEWLQPHGDSLTTDCAVSLAAS